jgi:hypothetical protein
MNTFKSVFEHYNWDDINPKFTPLQQNKSASTHKTKEIWMTFSTDICSPTLS